MNGAQLHLALNHLPVILSLAGFAVLLWGWLSKSPEIRKVGLSLVIVTALSAGAAFLTGEPAEDVLEKFPGFAKERVHEHEEAGEAALILSIIAGAGALISVYFTKKRPQLARYALLFSLLAVLISSLSFFRTAHLGGLIRHEEIRPGN